MVPGTVRSGSSIVMLVTVALPVFVTVNEYVIVSPTWAPPVPLVSLNSAALSSASEGDSVTPLVLHDPGVVVNRTTSKVALPRNVIDVTFSVMNVP